MVCPAVHSSSVAHSPPCLSAWPPHPARHERAHPAVLLGPPALLGLHLGGGRPGPPRGWSEPRSCTRWPRPELARQCWFFAREHWVTTRCAARRARWPLQFTDLQRHFWPLASARAGRPGRRHPGPPRRPVRDWPWRRAAGPPRRGGPPEAGRQPAPAPACPRPAARGVGLAAAGRHLLAPALCATACATSSATARPASCPRAPSPPTGRPARPRPGPAWPGSSCPGAWLRSRARRPSRRRRCGTAWPTRPPWTAGRAGSGAAERHAKASTARPPARALRPAQGKTRARAPGGDTFPAEGRRVPRGLLKVNCSSENHFIFR